MIGVQYIGPKLHLGVMPCQWSTKENYMRNDNSQEDTRMEMRKEVDVFDSRVGFAVAKAIDNNVGVGNETHWRKE